MKKMGKKIKDKSFCSFSMVGTIIQTIIFLGFAISKTKFNLTGERKAFLLKLLAKT